MMSVAILPFLLQCVYRYVFVWYLFIANKKNFILSTKLACVIFALIMVSFHLIWICVYKVLSILYLFADLSLLLRHRSLMPYSVNMHIKGKCITYFFY